MIQRKSGIVFIGMAYHVKNNFQANAGFDPIGRLMTPTSRNKPPDKSECDKLFKEMQEGSSQARNELIERHLRLVASIALKFKYTNSSIEDLMAEGIEGLVVALDKFDNSKGVKLSTYAAWWIRQRIQKYLSKFSNPVAIPHDVAQQKRREYLIRNELQLQLGRDPTEEELIAHMLRDKKMIARSKHAPNSSSSLDEPMGSSELTLAELLPESESTEKSYREKGSLSDDLKIALDFLDKREKKIIIWRFGINGKDRMILSEIARELGVTAERVRQIEDRAIRKLRALLLNKGKIDFQRLDELAKLKLSNKTSMSPLQLLLLGEQAA